MNPLIGIRGCRWEGILDRKFFGKYAVPSGSVWKPHSDIDQVEILLSYASRTGL